MSTPVLYISAFRVPSDGRFALVASRDFYEVHKLVCSGFDGRGAATAARVLFRFDIEGELGWLYVQSTIPPDWSRLSDRMRPLVVGPRPLVIPEADRLRFRLLARPSLRIGDKESEMRGQRISVVSEEGQRAWLDRKATAHGFRVVQCVLTDRVWHDSKRNDRMPDGSPKPLHATQFDGVLTVTDQAALVEAVADGIGTQKAYGFGLLSVAAL